NLSIYNIPPQINNSTMQVKPMDARWDDYIQFTALLEDGNVTGQQDSDDQAVQVTLHILEGDDEVRSITKPFLPGSMVLFSTKDRPLFNESDAGKNFSYRYSCTDGILGGRNTSWSMIGQGPNLKAESKILVKDMVVTPEDQNCYWWQRYSFGLKAKSWNPDGEILTVTLFTDTPAHPGKRVASKTVRIQGDNYTDVVFEDLEPFDVRDSGQPFRYYFEYSLPDEKGETRSQLLEGPRAINTKLVRYKIYSPVMAANLIAILAACLLLGMGLERRDGILEWALRRWRR
ncbi:MAG: hypothetical protein QUS08_06940, partial [Methanothrix sp.]|nr:hypothetical protein [Methanothrix sp.]